MKRRVLVVDDDESIRQFIELALTDDGYEVATAADGAAALVLLHRFRPGVILLDMRMPGMDGWKFAKAYRKLPRPHAPVVVLTAARDAALSASEIHADDFLAKPFDLRDLMRIVARYTEVGAAAPADGRGSHRDPEDTEKKRRERRGQG